jgi:acyl dehydratase
MALITVSNFDEFAAYEGKELGSSAPHTVTQEQVNKFADATIDHQWIHTDPEKAKDGPFGTTIAHGYLSLSLVPYLWNQILEATNLKMMVNYGIENLRFTQPVKVGSEVILHAKLAALTNLRGIAKSEVEVKLEIVGEKKPAFSAKLILLYHFNE